MSTTGDFYSPTATFSPEDVGPTRIYGHHEADGATIANVVNSWDPFNEALRGTTADAAGSFATVSHDGPLAPARFRRASNGIDPSKIVRCTEPTEVSP